MRKRVGLFAFALVVACGNMGMNVLGDGGGSGGNGGSGGAGGSGGTGGTGGAPDYTSGTRIKARVISTADGAKAFAGYYDTTLSTACSFQRAADDTLRCLPTTNSYLGTFYADSGCSTPLAYATGCAPTYAYQTEATTTCVDTGYGGSSARYHVYTVGAPFAGQAWSGTPGACNMTTAPYPLYSVGSEVPASSFAAGSVDIAP